MASKNVNEIPYSIRRNLCRLLDVDGNWKLLAEEIGLSVDRIQQFNLAYLRPSGSPTCELLTYWSHSNATVEMLVSLLQNQKLLRAADLLQTIVPEMFDLDVHLPVHQNDNLRKKPEPKTVPNCKQMEDDFNLPLPFLSSDKGISMYKQPKDNASSNEHIQDWDRQKPNIAVQSSCLSKSSQKLSSYGKDCRPLNTCSENVTSGSSMNFHSPCQSGEFSGDFSSQKERRRVPIMHSHSDAVESHDVTSSVGSHDFHKNPVSSRKPASVSSLEPYCFLIRYPYADIAAATNGFLQENHIGQGGFGVVFRGNIKKTTFAIKFLNKRGQTPTSLRDFMAEINSLSKFRHKNIITLSGCSVDGPVVCLVYEYMVNGSLQDRLECKNNTKPLSWMTRHGILKDAAAGLQYLHTVEEKPLIHGDIKSANILLGPHFEAKISDFGLAKEATGGTATGKFTHVTRNEAEKVYGSKAYLPEEFFNGGYQFNIKTDTYSFGVVIFETCTGEKPDDSRREGGKLLTEYIRNVMVNSHSHLLIAKDKRTPTWPNELWLEVMMLGLSCTEKTKKIRPLMGQVHEKLETLHQEMQLNSINKVENKPAGAEDESHLHPSYLESEKSYHVLHQGSAGPNSLHAGNSLLFENCLSPFELQKSYDDRKSDSIHQKKSFLSAEENDSSLVYECAEKKLQIEEPFTCLSIEDNNVKNGWQKKHEVPVQPVVSDDRGFKNSEKCPKIQKTSTEALCQYKCENIKETCAENRELPVNGDSKIFYPSECLQNFVNEEIEHHQKDDNVADSCFKWMDDPNCEEALENNSTASIMDDGMTAELEKKKHKKFPDFMQNMYEQLMNNNKQDNVNLEEENEEDEEEGISNTQIDISYLNSSHGYNPSVNGIQKYSTAEIDWKCKYFIPAASNYSEQPVPVTEDKGLSGSAPRQVIIAREDQLRLEKLEQLRKSRLQQN